MLLLLIRYDCSAPLVATTRNFNYIVHITLCLSLVGSDQERKCYFPGTKNLPKKIINGFQVITLFHVTTAP